MFNVNSHFAIRIISFVELVVFTKPPSREYVSDCLLEPSSFKERLPSKQCATNSGEPAGVLLENGFGNMSKHLDAIVNRHSQSTEHNGDNAAFNLASPLKTEIEKGSRRDLTLL